MAAVLYGVGVGPGDPELITLKAVRIIQESPVLAVPETGSGTSVALEIIKKTGISLSGKTISTLSMPMTKERPVLDQSHSEAAKIIGTYLESGRQVAFLTLGDPCIYSTYMYVHEKIQKMGYQTEIVNGIPSFCAVSARLNQGLVEQGEPLHIIPASYPIEKALELRGTKVFMKAGKKLGEVKRLLLEHHETAAMVENCGMDGEKIYESLDEIEETAGYYSLIVVKEK